MAGPPARPRHAALPYVAPFVIFLLLTEVSRWFPGSQFWIYPLKTAVAAGLLWWFRSAYGDLRVRWSWVAVGVGLLVLGLWIPLSHDRLLLTSQSPVSPWEVAGGWAVPWIAVRLAGSALVVPVMEELFWRSFLPRYLVNPDFARVPIGAYTPSAFIVSSVLFGVEHNQWVAGIMAGVAYAWLLHRTRSVPQCILAHAVTNGLLGVYVLVTGDWRFW